MKTKHIYFALYFLILSILLGCDCWPWEYPCEDPILNGPKYEDAIAQINSFKNELLNQTSNNAVAVKSSQSARPGEVWILNDCDNTIHNYASSIIDRFSKYDYSLMSDPLSSKTYEFKWENKWIKSYSIEADVKFEILEVVFKAAAEYSQIQTITFKLSFQNPQYIRVKNISDLRNEYESYLTANGYQTDGNIIVSAIIKGNLNIEYNAVNESGEKIEIDLSTKVNELIEELSFLPGYKHFQDKGSIGGFSIIEQSGDNPTVFAIEYSRISSDLQNRESVTNIINEYCDNDEVLVLFKKVPGWCLSDNKNNIIDLRLESDAYNERFYFYWTNKSDKTITTFHYKLTIRNRFGQILTRRESFVIDDINPGVTLPSGNIQNYLPGGRRFNLHDVEFELVITEARSGFDIVCN